MKRNILVLVVLALSLSLSSPAPAAGPPGSLAFQWQNNPHVYTVLAVKAAGNVKMSNQTLKFYTLNGLTYDDTAPTLQYPVSGTGYLIPSSGGLMISLSGTILVPTGSPPFSTTNFVNLTGALPLDPKISDTGDIFVRDSADDWGPYAVVIVKMVNPHTLTYLDPNP